MVARLAAQLLAVACVLLMAGCAALSAPEPAFPERAGLDAFELDGRFTLRQEARSYSGRLNWTHSAVGDELLLSSPFGQGIAEVVNSAVGARLTTAEGKVFEAADVETLTEEVLGYSLPLRWLADWVRGRAGTGSARFDEAGRLARLHHQSWRIDYEYRDPAPGAPPARLLVTRGDEFELRLAIEAWRSLLPEGTQP